MCYSLDIETICSECIKHYFDYIDRKFVCSDTLDEIIEKEECNDFEEYDL